jgi:hypothetical protein
VLPKEGLDLHPYTEIATSLSLLAMTTLSLDGLINRL